METRDRDGDERRLEMMVSRACLCCCIVRSCNVPSGIAFSSASGGCGSSRRSPRRRCYKPARCTLTTRATRGLCLAQCTTRTRWRRRGRSVRVSMRNTRTSTSRPSTGAPAVPVSARAAVRRLSPRLARPVFRWRRSFVPRMCCPSLTRCRRGRSWLTRIRLRRLHPSSPKR